MDKEINNKLFLKAKDGDVKARNELIMQLMPRLQSKAERLVENYRTKINAMAEADGLNSTAKNVVKKSTVTVGPSVEDIVQEGVLAVIDVIAGDISTYDKFDASLSKRLKERLKDGYPSEENDAKTLRIMNDKTARLEAKGGHVVKQKLGVDIADSRFEEMENNIDNSLLKGSVNNILGTLSEREDYIVRRRFDIDDASKTGELKGQSGATGGDKLSVIAGDIGMSKSQVRTIEAKALRKMRTSKAAQTEEQKVFGI